jgi:carboxylesterase
VGSESPGASGAGERADGGFALPGHRSLACLLLHGFTATPEEVRPLAMALAGAGFAARAVRLPGHATTLDELARTGWRDWLDCAEQGLAAARASAPRTAVAGVSLGALLALLLAARRPTEVAAVVCCATPLLLSDRRPALLRSLRWLPPLRRRYAMLPKVGGRDIGDAAARAASRSYDLMPLPALLSFLELRTVVRRQLGRVTQPALVLHGRHDHMAPLTNVALLQRRLGSRWIESRILERSWHVLTEDVERDEVCRLAVDFLTRVEAA